MMAYLLYSLLLLSVQKCYADMVNYNDSCREDNCSTCFNKLAALTLMSSENQYNLQATYFPPDRAPPVLVIVNYNFVENQTEFSETWVWSTSTFYLLQPPFVLQYTSLFFTDPEFRKAELNLKLPIECANASVEHKKLLTQRLQIFAMKRTIYPQINSDYSPQAETAETLGKVLTNVAVHIIVATYVILPFVTGLAYVMVAIYFLYGNPHKFKNKLFKLMSKGDYDDDDNNSDDNHNHSTNRRNGSSNNNNKRSNKNDDNDNDNDFISHVKWDLRSKLNMLYILSFWSALYMFCMSAIAVSVRDDSNSNEESKLKEVIYNEKYFKLLYKLPVVMLIVDSIIMLYFLFYSLVMIYNYCDDTYTWWWIMCIFSPVFPIGMLSVHFCHIVIGFIHNSYHAKSVGLFYGSILLTEVILYRIISGLSQLLLNKCSSDNHQNIDYSELTTHKHGYDKTKLTCNNNACFFIAYFILSPLLVLLFVFVAALYFELPINTAFDDAPIQVNDIVTSVVLVFYAYILYWLLKVGKKQKSYEVILKNKTEYELKRLMK